MATEHSNLVKEEAEDVAEAVVSDSEGEDNGSGNEPSQAGDDNEVRRLQQVQQHSLIALQMDPGERGQHEERGDDSDDDLYV